MSAVVDYSFSLEQLIPDKFQIVGIVGSSNVGKSTLLFSLSRSFPDESRPGFDIDMGVYAHRKERSRFLMKNPFPNSEKLLLLEMKSEVYNDAKYIRLKRSFFDLCEFFIIVYASDDSDSWNNLPQLIDDLPSTKHKLLVGNIRNSSEIPEKKEVPLSFREKKVINQWVAYVDAKNESDEDLERLMQPIVDQAPEIRN
eukprot:TRINITY_DN11077_c0_g1_i1.p1 TRINITY_DN11077_c0_g1~~TRINITY_DN11077_c0_g1_i1.p1  ORF type:complete len:198 (-),score=46.34 TRINITY_DN11077_c0_g1_i1:95-688(-)